ncbi:MAG: anti-sigma factor antagonist [Spirochaetaceae bacterium]|jgi:anti-anti-sigma factor|nr:anti-sigma factor antagonist [Spirochaetaceae bacterium]
MNNNEIVPGFDAGKDDSLKIDLKRPNGVEGALILALTGYIDTYNSASFQKRVTKAIESGFVKLIFDCGGLNYVSSTGIGSFTSFLKTLKAIHGDLVLLDVQPKVYEVFQLLGFSQFFNIRGSMEEAESFFKKDALQSAAGALFPKIFDCPICGKKLKAVKSGRFRCSECKTILSVDGVGQVFLG